MRKNKKYSPKLKIVSAYAEELFNFPDVWEFILDGEPSLKDKVLSFFSGAPKKYSFAPEMDPAAKKWIREYKKLFDQVARINAGMNASGNVGASNTVKKIERIGKITNDSDYTNVNSNNSPKIVRKIGNIVENVQKEPLTSINRENMQVSGRRHAVVEQKKFAAYNKPITIEDIDAIHNIAAQKKATGQKLSINAFTKQDIEITQKWAHKDYQELGVKSPFFRAWYGDWRAHQTKTNVEIADIPQYVDSNEARKQNRGVVKNNDTQWEIRISREGETNTISHSGDGRLSEYGLSGIRGLIENAVLFDSEIHEHHSNNAKNEAIAFNHKMYSLGLDESGNISLYKITVEEYFQSKSEPSNKKFHNLRYIQKIADNVGGRTSENTRSGGSTNDTSAIYSISDLYEFVKSYDKDFTPAPEISPLLLNKDGTPKLFYHGTNAEFRQFDLSKSGSNFGNVAEGMFFFTDKKQAYPNSAKDYAREAVKTKGGSEQIYEVYIAMQKPLVIDSRFSYDPVSYYDANQERIYEQYFNGDYDGIIVRDSTGKSSTSTLVMVDKPSQIKSATDNIGTFSKYDPDIRHALKNHSDYKSKIDAKANEKVAKATEKANKRADKRIETEKAKLHAEYETDAVFNQTKVNKALSSIEAFNKLPSEVKREILSGDIAELRHKVDEKGIGFL